MYHDAVRVKSHHSSVSPSTPEGKGKNVGDDRCAVERNREETTTAAALLHLEDKVVEKAIE
jgi:hypothetical protein